MYRNRECKNSRGGYTAFCILNCRCLRSEKQEQYALPVCELCCFLNYYIFGITEILLVDY